MTIRTPLTPRHAHPAPRPAIFAAAPRAGLARRRDRGDQEELRRVRGGLEQARCQGSGRVLGHRWRPHRPVGRDVRRARRRREVSSASSTRGSGKLAKSTYENKSDSVRLITPDVAVEDWQVILTGLNDPDGKPMGPRQIHYVVIVSKKDGGKWQIAAGRGPGPADGCESGSGEARCADQALNSVRLGGPSRPFSIAQLLVPWCRL